jgi:hypothetical protein
MRHLMLCDACVDAAAEFDCALVTGLGGGHAGVVSHADIRVVGGIGVVLSNGRVHGRCDGSIFICWWSCAKKPGDGGLAGGGGEDQNKQGYSSFHGMR